MSVFPPPSEAWRRLLELVIRTFYSSITGLNNSDPDVMVTVTASNRAGQGNMSILVHFPPSLGKCYITKLIANDVIIRAVPIPNFTDDSSTAFTNTSTNTNTW